jgi:predicted amidohydrolase YtcJ
MATNWRFLKRAVSGAVVVSCAVVAAAQAPTADLVLINGKILTVDAKDSVAEGVAVRAGKILATGTTKEILARALPNARVIDLHGLTVTPGLIDSHLHFTETNTLYELNFADSRSINDVIARVREKAASLKPGEWIRGEQWDESKLAEKRYVTAADLDKAAPNNPVWMTQSTGHYGVANSYALKLGNITAATKDPPAGTIDRDPQGNPTGVLKEGAAMGLVTRRIPPYTPDQNRQGVLRIIADSNREGITAVKDPAIRENKWELYQALLKEDKLTVHVFALWLGGRTMESARQVLDIVSKLPKPPQSFGDGLLISGGIKLYIDGSGGGRTGWMYQDWNKEAKGTDAGNSGYPVTEPAVYRQQVQLFHNAGLHVGTHAVGDRGIDEVVDAYAEAIKAKPTVGLRHSIIHSNLPTDHAIAVMADLQKRYDAGYPEAQAEFMWWIGDTYAGNYGPARSPRLLPFKTFVAKGIQWGGGSDFPGTPFAPRYGLWASVARETLDGVYGKHPFGTSESIDIHTALRSYTLWSAHQLFLEKQIGSIEAGKDADFAVWDKDMYRIPTEELRNLKCEMTILRGKIVYQSSTAPVTVGTARAK